MNHKCKKVTQATITIGRLVYTVTVKAKYVPVKSNIAITQKEVNELTNDLY